MNYQIFFIFLFIVTLFCMKLSSLFLSSKQGSMGKIDFKFLFNSPLIVPKTKKQNISNTNDIKLSVLKQFIFHSLVVLFTYDLYYALFKSFEFSMTEKAYLFSFYVYFFTNFIAQSARVFSLLANEVPVDMHNKPYLSKSLTEFWGTRWNKWVQDWLNLVSKKCAPRSIKMRMFWAFFFSGLFHEAMFTLPYSLYYKENAMGLMMIYFLFQFAFMILDREVLRKYTPGLRPIFMWVFVLGPIPFFVNKPLLSFFGLLS